MFRLLTGILISKRITWWSFSNN